MTSTLSLKAFGSLLLALVFTASTQAALTDIATEPLNTYSAPSSTDVKPNVLFILDDSGSMDWDFMPDWACTSLSTRNSSCQSIGQSVASGSDQSEYLFRNASYNGIYYNPAIMYKPPIHVGSSGATDTTTYPSMTGVSTTTGGDSTASTAAPNWKAVRDDAYGVQSTLTTKSNLVSDSTKPARFFTTVAGEYCTTPSLRVCTTASAPSASYPYPANLRWCNSSALTTCQAAYS